MRNETIYISSKSHLNLTFNLLQCSASEIWTADRIAVRDSDSFLLAYLNTGVGLLETDEFTSEISASQGFFIFPDTSYTLKNTGKGVIRLVTVSFTGYLVGNYLSRANIKRSNPLFHDNQKELGEKINRIYAASRRLPNRYCRMMSILYDIFSHLLDANPTRGAEGEADNAEYYTMKATNYIEENYNKTVNVDEVAQVLGISRKHLYGVFHNVLKISPKQYLIYYRIEKACMRLKSTKQSVGEIAQSVGYANQFYFAKEFKRLTGKTPSEYRKETGGSEIFSYHSVAAALRKQMEDFYPSLPVEEEILSVYTPPQTRMPEGK